MKIKNILTLFVCVIVLVGSLAGCTNAIANTQSDITTVIDDTKSKNNSEMFSDRDMQSSYDEDKSITINMIDNNIKSDSKNVSILKNIVTISDEGSYILKGSLSDGQIIVDAEKTDKIQIVLDNIEISNTSSAPIYVKQADKVFITLAKDSNNKITVKGEIITTDDNNIDAAIFSKEDLSINGSGSLTIENKYGNGITSKDDLVVANGIINIDASGHGLEGKDSVRIANGEFKINSGKDGIHCGNSIDTEIGLVYIANGNFNISSEDDGIHADLSVIIQNGTINIAKSYEGIEGKTIDINGGTISLLSSDDGINATGSSIKNQTIEKSTVENNTTENNTTESYIKIIGGLIKIDVEGDGLDANGSIYITGGETYISGPQSDRNAAIDYDEVGMISGGKVIATGFSGMSQNFGETSTQGSILITAPSITDGAITLKASDNKEIVNYTPVKSYNSVVISTPDIKKGQTYVASMGDEVQNIEMTNLIYGIGGGPGGMGNQKPGFGKNRPEGEAPDGRVRPENRNNEGVELPVMN